MRNMTAGVRLVTQSAALLRRHPHLLVLPLLSGLSILVVVGGLYAGVYYGLEHISPTMALVDDRVWPLVGALAYFLVSVVSLFFTTALVVGTREIFQGRRVSVRRCLQAAWSQKWRILRLAVVMATVGLLLRSFEKRSGRLRKLGLKLAGAAWSAATWLVVPAMVAEKQNIRTTLRRSGTLVRRTWGGAVIGAVGVPVVSFVLVWLVAVPLVGLMATTNSTPAVIGSIVVVLSLFLMLRSALGGVFSSALYEYASTGRIPQGFDQEALDDAVRVGRLGATPSRQG